MSIHHFEKFLTMGGYAKYVWPTYGIVAIVLVWNVIRPIRWRRRLLRQLQQTQSQQHHS